MDLTGFANYTLPIVVQDNIFIHGSIVGYMYAVSPAAIISATKDTIEAANMMAIDAMLAVNMQGGIAIFSDKLKLEEAKEFMWEDYEKHGFPELRDVASDYINKLASEFHEAYNKKSYFLYFIQNRDALVKRKKGMNMFGNTVNHLALHQDAMLMKKLFAEASITEAVIRKKVRKCGLTLGKCSSELTRYVFDRTELPLRNIDQLKTLPTLHPHAGNDYMMLEYRTLNNRQELSYVRYLHVTSSMLEEPTAQMASLLTSNLNVQVFAKYDLVPSSEFLKKIEEQQENLSAKQEKHKKSYAKSNKELADQQKLAAAVQRHVEATRDTQVIYALTFRLETQTLEDLEKQTEVLEEELHGLRLKVSTLHHRQELAHQHVHPCSPNLLKHLRSDIYAFSHLSFFSGEEIGDSMGYPIFQNFYSGQPAFEYTRNIITGVKENKAKENAITSLVIGGTGSGKSFLAFMIALYRLVLEGRPQLKITPKNDEKDVGTHLVWMREMSQIINFGTRAVDIGALDAFILYKDDIPLAIEIACTDIQAMLDAVSIRHKYDLKYVHRAVDALIQQDKVLTMTRVVNTMLEMEDEIAVGMAENLLGIAKSRQGSLFFGSDDTQLVLDYSKKFLVLNMHGIPKISEYDHRNIEHVLANRMITRCERIVDEWNAYWGERVTDVSVDEIRIMQMYPQAVALIASWNLMLRSAKTFLTLIMQNVSHIKEGKLKDVLNNYAIAYIGDASTEEERFILHKDLGVPESLIDDLKDRADKIESMNGTDERDEHPFVYGDYNGRFGTIEIIVPQAEAAADYNSRDGG